MTPENCIDTLSRPVTMSLTWRGWVKDGKRLISVEIKRTWSLVKAWDQRSRMRHELSTLSDRTLKDIGVTRAQIDLEIQKPLWKD